MKQNQFSLSAWSKGVWLCTTLIIGSTYFGNHTPEAAAAAVSDKQAVYNQFQQYISSPAGLIQARNYLLNHIDEAGAWYGTVMTLRLENAQAAELGVFSERIYPEPVQEAIDSAAAKSGLSYTGLLTSIQDAGIRKLLIEARDKGYKIESSEGMYYPVMHYEGFRAFQSYIAKDVAAYIDLMATESNRPASYDAGIVITWDEVIARAVIMEDFIQKYPKSNRISTVRTELGYAVSRMFYGEDNTPAYDYDSDIIDPALKRAYKDVLLEGPGDSHILKIVQNLLLKLEAAKNQFTPAIESYLKNALKGLVNE